MFVVALGCYALDVMIVFRQPLSLRSPRAPSARTVEAIARPAFHDRSPIDVHVVEANTHAHHCGVIAEHAAHPNAAQEPNAGISESVVNAAVKSDMRAPVAFVPNVHGTLEPPVSGSPEQPDGRRLYPHARNPKIPRFAVPPITRRPQVPGSRADRLLIYRKHWRCDANPHSHDLRHGCRRHNGQRRKKQHPTEMFVHNCPGFLCTSIAQIGIRPRRVERRVTSG
jgi:hypothetical protein